MADILQQIYDARKADITETKKHVPLDALKEWAPAREEDRFLSLFQNANHFLLIAEVKKASPSRGVIREDFDPVHIAREYTDAGADAISVLTEERHFQGALSYIPAIREVTDVPILRKDFIFDEYQVYEALASGADSFLLIAAMLDDATLRTLFELGALLKLTPVVEVHTKEELARVSALNAPIIGINNRDLKTFETSLDVTDALMNDAPEGAHIISESGIFTRDDVLRLESMKVAGMLVGEAIMREANIKEKIWELTGKSG